MSQAQISPSCEPVQSRGSCVGYTESAHDVIPDLCSFSAAAAELLRRSQMRQVLSREPDAHRFRSPDSVHAVTRAVCPVKRALATCVSRSHTSKEKSLQDAPKRSLAERQCRWTTEANQDPESARAYGVSLSKEQHLTASLCTPTPTGREASRLRISACTIIVLQSVQSPRRAV